MQHRDHVELIRHGVEGGSPNASWLELGAGEGAFTLALAEVLGPGAHITAVDRDRTALRTLEHAVARYDQVEIESRAADFTVELPGGSFDGVLAANSLHFVRDRRMLLAEIKRRLVAGGRLVVVEYDADRGNPWVPHPFSFESWRREARVVGFEDPQLIGRVPSRFLGAIYAAVTRQSG